MKCPVCGKEMKKVNDGISNNLKQAELYKEYKKITYQCEDDDAWVVTETPITKKKP